MGLTWGVLDRLLEHGGIRVKAISATSSGAMNAVMLAHGLSLKGPERAFGTGSAPGVTLMLWMGVLLTS